MACLWLINGGDPSYTYIRWEPILRVLKFNILFGKLKLLPGKWIRIEDVYFPLKNGDIPAIAMLIYWDDPASRVKESFFTDHLFVFVGKNRCNQGCNDEAFF